MLTYTEMISNFPFLYTPVVIVSIHQQHNSELTSRVLVTFWWQWPLCWHFVQLYEKYYLFLSIFNLIVHILNIQCSFHY